MQIKFAAPILGMLLSCGLFAAQAHASTTLGFYGLTSNDPGGNAVIDGEASLRVEVIDLGGNEVRFLFTNDSDFSSLTDVYFADGALLGISNIEWSSFGQVAFSSPATPANLPAANLATPSFQVTAGFSADSDSPVAKNGVQNSDVTGEWLAIDFNLINGKTYDDVIAALALPVGGDWLRIGLHVQGYPCGTPGCTGTYSESFLNNAYVSSAPEMQSYALILAGIGLIALATRGRKRP
jgi:hypothetical protein